MGVRIDNGAVMLQIVVNGKPREIESGRTVENLLQELDLIPARVVVERNREIVPRDAFSATRLEPDDRLEILHFVGGG